MKDNFSKESDKYARYRPHYPKELYDFILSRVPKKELAWDCATGNGQVAFVLAQHFKSVMATDLSQQQVSNAIHSNKINYSVQIAEETNFQENSFDLITVGQAIHWFKFETFFKEVKRVLKPTGVFTAFGYGLNSVNPEIDTLIHHFYHEIIGGYWDNERKHIDNEYASIEFPFKKVESRKYYHDVLWDVDHYIGYLNTWSAVKHYISKEETNPINQIEQELRNLWGHEKLSVRFPIFLTLTYN